MGLKAGTFLGQYEILSLLGVGGMGEVYRARDSKLNREVALKVLPEAFARDPERIGRFRREAQVLAALDHPNIARIYAFEESGSTRFLVMELAEGETLKERIKRGKAVTSDEWRVTSEERTGTSPRHKQRAVATSGTGGIALEEAVEICKQIAAGLEAAHEKAIVHRDLKPANVKVTPEGVVKVLDFGLAKAFAGDTGSGDPADSPTLSAMTQPGTILGTAAYMSPEQARGRKVDKRTDVWALGCVLYEMLAGKHAFDGEDVPEILASVMKGEPDWTALPEGTPRGIRRLLQRCLQKDAAKRFHSAADMAIEMEEALQEPDPAAGATTVSAPAPVVASKPAWRKTMPWVGVFAFGLLIAGIAVWYLKPAPPQAVTRFAVTLPPTQQFTYTGRHLVTVSPDGTKLVYGAEQLYLRAMDDLEPTPLRGTEGATNAFFSPDGQWVGFWARGQLQKVSITGGAPVTLCETGNPYGASWGADDRIVFGQGPQGIWQVPGTGGTKELLVALEGLYLHGPQVLPGGNAVLFTATRTPNWNDAQIMVQDLETGERRVLIEGGTDARYAATGHLIYSREATLLAAPFDLERLEVTGGPVPIVEGVAQALGQTGAAQFGFSGNGSLAYIPGSFRQVGSELVWVDRQGTIEPLDVPRQAYLDPRLSPDGQRIVVRIVGESTDIWVYDISRNTLTRLTFEGVNQHPAWTSDGSRLTFRSNRDGPPNIYWKPADGSGPAERLTTSEGSQSPSSWSPDGRFLAFYGLSTADGASSATDYNIGVLPLEGERKPQPFLQTPFGEGEPMFSPDGHWLAYVSTESGRNEVYVQPYPGPGGKWQISTAGGGEPVWARNGREMFFRNGDQMMAVAITTEPTFSAGTPRLLFEGTFVTSTAFRGNYDVTPDGQRFVMLKPDVQAAGAQQINVVLNWFEELRRRVPSGQ